MAPEPVAAVYADGGVIRINPSPFGGTWACCHVSASGAHLWESSGIVLPQEVEMPVTNNQTEFYAALRGLEALPDGWSGGLVSDSNVTLLRFCKHGQLKNIPEAWAERMQIVMARMGRVLPVLLDGHPTVKQLQDGVGKRGHRVSMHNVWCDKECGRVGVEYMKHLELGTEPKILVYDLAAPIPIEVPHIALLQQ